MELLEQHFDIAFGTPEGIKKLRELILTLAMQGKLVPQDASDPPASQLLKNIDAEKKRLVKDGKIKAPRRLPETSQGEVPYDLPRGWVWSTLAQVALINPRNNVPDSTKVSFVPMTLIGTGHDGAHDQEVRTWADVKQGFTHFAEGDIGVAKITPCFENSKACVFSNLKSGLGAGTTELHIVRPVAKTISPRYVLAYLKSPQFLLVGQTKMTGTAGQKRLPKEFVESNPFPLPPLPEQYRIVAKIDQLMARCDELERLRARRDQQRRIVHAAALKELLDAQTPQGIADAWQFISQNFGDLYAVKENVTELRKAVLQLAAMGKLVPQDPDDPPASQLLKEIEAEKRRLVKEGKIAVPKPLPAIKQEEVPYELPKGWEWVRLESLLPEYQNGISKREGNAGAETVVLRLADIVKNEVSLTSPRLIRLTEREQSQYSLNSGDILITRVNGSLDLVGTFVLVGETDIPVAYCDHFIRLRLRPSIVDVRYIHLISKSSLVRRQIEAKFITTAGQKTVNQTHVSTLFLPLPPLKMQHRIVTKAQQLMALCDALEQKVDSASSKQVELLNALMATRA